MPRSLPSLRSLQVFSSVARHQSVSLAAEDLCLTHSALSQQLRKLEAWLGVKLFHRSSQGVKLTEAGSRYQRQVDDDLLRLEGHLLDVMARREGDITLLVGAVPVVAERWLMPRLAAFTTLHPRVNLQVRVFPSSPYLTDLRCDAAIHYHDAVWPGSRMQALMHEDCVAVCAPDAPFTHQVRAGDYGEVPLLHLASRPQAWQDWFAQAAVRRAPANPLAGHRLELFSMLVEAVRARMGIGLVPRFYVERELASGDLLMAHSLVLAGSRNYAVFVPEHKGEDPAVAAFVQWLFAEVATSA